MTVQEWLGKDNELGIKIWTNKYCFNNETFDQWLDRVSGGDKDLRQLIADKKFLFGGRTLANRGTNKKGSFSNCYSVGYVPDDLKAILKYNEKIGLTFKAQGGQGLSLSKLRPKGTPIDGQYTSDGIIPFMKLYNETTSTISQGGSRKGALMMSLDIWHKEAEQFITIKSQEGVIEKANLSLEIDDDFMRCVQEDYMNGTETQKQIVREYEGNRVVYEVVPIHLYKKMMEMVWDWGEPGCIFTERFRNYNMMQYCENYEIETSNPCGEQPLPAGGACNLGSINLAAFIEDPYTKMAYFKKDEFFKAVEVAIKALDVIVDENLKNHALEEQKEQAYKFRNIGLGIMGLADALIMMGITYGSQEAITFCYNTMQTMFIAALTTSIYLAKEKGAFPGYTDKVWDAEIIKNNIPEILLCEGKKYGVRNCSLLSIAPTGSIGSMLGISGGCEPEFALSFYRTTKSLDGETDVTYKVEIPAVSQFKVVNPNVKELPDYFVTSENISWKDRVDMQAALQHACDTAISSTVNLKQETTKEEIEHLYLYAWSKGLKGVTAFRSGCKRVAILSKTKNTKTEEPSNDKPAITDPKNRIGKIRTLTTGCGTLHLTCFFDKYTGRLVETFFAKGSTGGCNNYMNGLSRMISLSAKKGASVDEIIDQLNSTGACPSYVRRTAVSKDTSKGSCCAMAAGYAIKEMYEEMQSELNDCLGTTSTESTVSEDNSVSTPVCPECGTPINMAEGCMSCPNCGFSKCG